MKTIEIDPRLPAWLNGVLNRWPFAIDANSVATSAAGYGASDDEARRDWRSLRVGRFLQSMFWNAPIFIRVTTSWAALEMGAAAALLLTYFVGWRWWFLVFALGVWVYIRVSPTRTIQMGAGYKINGRAAILLRTQTDDSAARGTLGPNSGQSVGWRWGPH